MRDLSSALPNQIKPMKNRLSKLPCHRPEFFTLKWPLLLAALGVSVAGAADYAIDWFTVDSGGGTSTNGQYSLTGTIGQPDAGTMSGGAFTLQGGFWGIVTAVQTPGAPTLTVTRNDTAVIVSWPAPAEGWRLHATTNLLSSGTVWKEIAPPYQTNGLTNLSFTESAPMGSKFYRLHKP